MATLKELEARNPFISPNETTAAGKMETQHLNRYVQTINTKHETHAQKLERQAAERAANAAAHAAKKVQDEQEAAELERWLNAAAEAEQDAAQAAAAAEAHQARQTAELLPQATETPLQTIEWYIWANKVPAIAYNVAINGTIVIEFEALTIKPNTLAKMPKIRGYGKEIGAGIGRYDTPSPAIIYYNRAERKRQNKLIKKLL